MAARLTLALAAGLLAAGCREDGATAGPTPRRFRAPRTGQRADGSTFDCERPDPGRCAPIFASCGCRWTCPEHAGEVGCDVVCENESEPPPPQLQCRSLEGRCIAPRPAVGDRCIDAPLVAFGELFGVDTMPARDDLAGSCAGAGAPDVVRRIEVPVAGTLRVYAPQSWGGVVYVRRACGDASSEIACGWADGDRALVEAAVEPGPYFVVVDATCNYAGATELRVELERPDEPG